MDSQIKKIGLKKILYILNKMFIFASRFARVAELVDALDSKSSVFGRVGSIPTSSTLENRNYLATSFYGFFVFLDFRSIYP